MIAKTRKTHLLPAALLLAVAVLPSSPLWTLGAYGDTETSNTNIFQAGEWGEVLEIAQFSLLLDEPSDEPTIESGEVAGTSTEESVPEEPVVEISEPIVEITTPESPAEETPPAEEEPAPPAEEEPTQPVEEETPAETTPTEEPTPEPEAEPEPEPAPELTPSTDQSS